MAPEEYIYNIDSQFILANMLGCQQMYMIRV